MPTSQITIYKDTDYQGTSRSFSVGSYVLAEHGFPNDALSSLKVPDGLKVTLYQHSDFSGRRMLCVRDTSSLGGDVNDEISSIKVEERGTQRVILYADPGYKGWSQELGTGRYANISLGNDCVSSLIVPQGYRVKLYKDTDYSGEMQVFYGNTSSLGDFGNEASSVVVEQIAAAPKPTLDELNALIQDVGPRLYLHPDDPYGPSSVEWFLQRATLKGKNGTSRNAASEPLPAGGSDDGAYWLEIAASHRDGYLEGAVAYVNAKCDNDYWIDLQFWIFYPYNGPGKARVWNSLGSNDHALDPMGQHGGDWEHVTCRVELASKKLATVYLAQHSDGEWITIGGMTMEDGHPVVFSSKHGHASYRREGTNGSNQTSAGLFNFELRNDTDKGNKVLHCASKYVIIGAAFLGDAFTAPSWVNYCRRWGPHKIYDRSELWAVLAIFLGTDGADDALDALPDEFKEENGPTGPWRKGSWDGPE